MIQTDFTTDYEKMIDFLQLDKSRFLESYSYLTEEEYDLTVKEFNRDTVGCLVYLFRRSEQLMLQETDRDITNDKVIITNASEEHLSESELCDFVSLII